MVEREALEQQGVALVRQAQDLAVIDGATFERAGEDVKLVKAYQKRVHEVFDPIVETANIAHKTAVAQRKKLLAPAEEAEAILKRAMGAYQAEQERLRREAEEAIRREQERLEAEAQRIADEEAERLRKEAEDAQIDRAAEAEAQGDIETAERILSAPVFVPTVTPMPVFTPPMTVPQAPKLNGVSFRDQYTAELVSLDDLIAAAAGGNSAAKSCLMFNQATANGLARSTRGTLTVPGVKFKKGNIAAIRV